MFPGFSLAFSWLCPGFAAPEEPGGGGGGLKKTNASLFSLHKNLIKNEIFLQNLMLRVIIPVYWGGPVHLGGLAAAPGPPRSGRLCRRKLVFIWAAWRPLPALRGVAGFAGGSLFSSGRPGSRSRPSAEWQALPEEACFHLGGLAAAPGPPRSGRLCRAGKSAGGGGG